MPVHDASRAVQDAVVTRELGSRDRGLCRDGGAYPAEGIYGGEGACRNLAALNEVAGKGMQDRKDIQKLKGLFLEYIKKHCI